jgi:flagellar export protein FliJ
VKAYRFRLESVLRVRQLQEQAAAQRLALAVRALHDARAELARARRSLETLAAPAGRLTAGAVEWAHEQSDRMAENARDKADEVQAAAEATRQARDLWGSARQRMATLERLDERHLALWRTEFDRSEAMVLDDLATRRTSVESNPS